MLCSYHSSDGEGSFEMDGIILFYSVLTKKKKTSYSPDFDNFTRLFFFLYSERRKRKKILFSSSLKLGLRRISRGSDLMGISPKSFRILIMTPSPRSSNIGFGGHGFHHLTSYSNIGDRVMPSFWILVLMFFSYSLSLIKDKEKDS